MLSIDLKQDVFYSSGTSKSPVLAIIDTGCSKNVCGQNFLTDYSLELQKRIIPFSFRKEYSSTKFSFANGESKRSNYSTSIPIFFGSKTFTVSVDVFSDVF